jgi:hypothetical protein
VGRFTKYAHFIPLKLPYSAMLGAHAFFNNIVKLHGRRQGLYQQLLEGDFQVIGH